MTKINHITGKRFGSWVVLKRGKNSKQGNVLWVCKCDCGKIKERSTGNLKHQKSQTCVCPYVPKKQKLPRNLTKFTSIVNAVDEAEYIRNIEFKTQYIIKVGEQYVVTSDYIENEKIVVIVMCESKD